jgi:uncharacterized protein DUF6519
MQGDFSRITFDRANHYSAVLSQQGRVTLDADINESAAIVLHHLRTTVADLIGPAGVPAGPDGGFLIDTITTSGKEPDLSVSAGRMYVDGILVENDADGTYWDQPDGHLDADAEGDRLPETPYLVYLRVWEQLVTALEAPALREIALGDLAPDTSARAKVVWQIAAARPDEVFGSPPGPPTAEEALGWLLRTFQRTPDQIPLLQARATRPDDADDDLCDVAPDARYRGPENQLYRVQIHTGGAPQAPAEPQGTRRRGRRAQGEAPVAESATFVFSRDNGAVEAPIASMSGNVVRLAAPGRDGKLAFDVGDWVEIVDDAYAARVADDVQSGWAPPLRRIRSVDAAGLLVTLHDDPPARDYGPQTGSDRDLHPVLRRWDHRPTAVTDDGRTLTAGPDGALPVVAGTWIELEKGVQVRFAPDDTGSRRYRRGDWWALAARVVTGDLWPADDEALRPPNGVAYHYAPLAWVDGDAADRRPAFPPATGVNRPAMSITGATRRQSRSRSATPARSATARKRAPRSG